MKDQVFMSPSNGQLAVGIPLFRYHNQDLEISGYSIALMTQNKPIAYIIECFDAAQVMSAEFVESRMICLGDL